MRPDEDRPWLPNPPRGTSVCGGFDGSDNDDWTAIKLETREGFIFTPRFGPDRLPAIWNPAEHDGQIPHDQVDAAWDEICTTYDVLRVYCDPGFRDELSWESDIERWATEHPDAKGDPKIFLPWQMSGNHRINAVYQALKRFEADMKAARITQDGCPITEAHMANTRRIPKPGERYGLGKPSQHQKIDAGVTTVLCHEAASDMRAEGWPEHQESYAYVM